MQDKDMANMLIQQYQKGLQQEKKCYEEYQVVYQKAQEDYEKNIEDIDWNAVNAAYNKYLEEKKEVNRIGRLALQYVIKAGVL